MGFKYIATTESIDRDKILLSAKCYLAEVDVEYCHRLGNWIRDGHYLGWYSLSVDELGKQFARLSAINLQCHDLVSKWSKCHEACSKFYPCLAVTERAILARKAMRSSFFTENWEEGLKKLYMLMSGDFSEDDPRSYIKCTLQWFCNISPDKYTLAKILEGEYGSPPKRKKIKKKETETKQEDFSSPDDALDFFNTL